jgi:hypothetical protein
VSEPFDCSFTRYLEAKKSVDDRALNRHVLGTLMKHLPESNPEKPLKVLEIGAGIGGMIDRMMDWGILNYADYTAVDLQSANKAHAFRWLRSQSEKCGVKFSEISPDSWILKGKDQHIQVNFITKDFSEFMASEKGKWDLLVAHAFLDLVDVPSTLPLLFSRLEKKGLFYFTINFDGISILEPPIDPELDKHIFNLYHKTMDKRQINARHSGDSQTGRHLFSNLRNVGVRILDAGASDWCIFPIGNNYPNDEAYFLHFILNTIHRALENCPKLNANSLRDWIATRQIQVERGELTYIAHQLDLVGTT